MSDTDNVQKLSGLELQSLSCHKDTGVFIAFGREKQVDPPSLPLEGSCFFPSGCDVKVYIDGKQFSECQEISVNPSSDPNVIGIGRMKLIVLSQKGQPYYKFLGKETQLVLKASDEYGRSITLINALIKFNSQESFTFSIDDLLFHIDLGFTIKSRTMED